MRKLLTILCFILIGATDIKSQFVINPYYVEAASGTDADVTAYISATGIVDATTITAITNLVSDLKSNSLWTLGKLINPLPGTTATINKYNLKDPRDLDAAYRLTFTGTVTHSSTGMTGNGTTGFANTFLNANTDYSSGFMSLGIYSRTNTAGVYVDIGALSSSTRYLQIYSNLASTFYGQINSNNTISENTGNVDSRGWFFASRTGATAAFIQKNSTQNSFSTSSLVVNNNIYVMAQNNAGTAAFFSPRQIAFIWIGDALTTTQASSLYTIIQAYQTTMARQMFLIIFFIPASFFRRKPNNKIAA